MSIPIISTLGTLTSAGVTEFANSSESDNAVFQVTVTSIGTIARFKYFPTRLSNAALQAITAP
jgi:hypothetical protein